MAGFLAGQRIRALDFAGSAYDYESAVDTTTSTSYVTGTVHGVSFVAPTSGSVWIHFGGMLGSNTATIGSPPYAHFSIHVKTGSTIDAGTEVLAPSDDNGPWLYKQEATAANLYETVSHLYKLTGLTAGNSYNVVTKFRATAATANVNNRWISTQPAFE